MTPTKTQSFLLGTAYTSGYTIGHGGTPVNSTSVAIVFGADLKWWVTYPSSPGTVAVTIQPQVSDDNTHWTNDGGPIVVPIAASTVVSGTYQPPPDEGYARLQFVNADSSADVTAVVSASVTTGIS